MSRFEFVFQTTGKALGILGNVHLSVGVRIKAYVGVEIRPRDFRKCTFKCWG